MNNNTLNLCPKCMHAPYCVITHNQSAVYSCSEFDEKQQEIRTSIKKTPNRKPELVTI